MNIQAFFPTKHDTKPILEKNVLRLLTLLVFILALAAGYLYVQTLSQQRVIAALKRKYDACIKSPEQSPTKAQELDDTAQPR
jgi:hypothetical protein